MGQEKWQGTSLLEYKSSKCTRIELEVKGEEVPTKRMECKPLKGGEMLRTFTSSGEGRGGGRRAVGGEHLQGKEDHAGMEGRRVNPD